MFIFLAIYPLLLFCCLLFPLVRLLLPSVSSFFVSFNLFKTSFQRFENRLMILTIVILFWRNCSNKRKNQHVIIYYLNVMIVNQTEARNYLKATKCYPVFFRLQCFQLIKLFFIRSVDQFFAFIRFTCNEVGNIGSKWKVYDVKDLTIR